MEEKGYIKTLCVWTYILMLFNMIWDHEHMAQFPILPLQKSYFF